MPSNAWLELGLQWASLERPIAHQRLASALLRWRMLGPLGRAALVELVLDAVQPGPEAARQLEAARFVAALSGDRTCVAVYAGAAVVALEQERRALSPAQGEQLLAWYRKDVGRVRDVYLVFDQPRLVGTHAVFHRFDRAGFVVPRQGRIYRSTVRGWAVAWLLDDAAVLDLAGEGAA